MLILDNLASLSLNVSNYRMQKGIGNKMEKDAKVDWFHGWTQKVDRVAFYIIFFAYVLFIVIYTIVVSSR